MYLEALNRMIDWLARIVAKFVGFNTDFLNTEALWTTKSVD